jgi:hypothetical protein
MSDLARLKRIVLSLPDPALRVAWLADKLASWPPPDAARLLDRLCEASERSDPEAREALLAVSILFSSQAGSPLLEPLRAQAAQQHLLGLGRLLRRPPSTPEQRAPTESPVPDYGVGRELTLGERRSLARRPDRRAFEKLLRDPHPLVIRQLLDNPKLTHDEIVDCSRVAGAPVVVREVARAAVGSAAGAVPRCCSIRMHRRIASRWSRSATGASFERSLQHGSSVVVRAVARATERRPPCPTAIRRFSAAVIELPGA